MKALFFVLFLALGWEVLVFSCVLPDTVVLLENNSAVPISDIGVGSAVWGVDQSDEASLAKPIIQHVVQIFKRNAEQLVHITLQRFSNEKGGWNETEVVLSITPDHEVYVKEEGWVEAGDLEPGDSLVSLTGEDIIVLELQLQNVSNDTVVLNIEVLNYHAYCASDLHVLVHNGKKKKRKINWGSETC